MNSNNNIITDPETAARNYGGTLNYTDFCGFLCVPRDPNKKKMTMYPNAMKKNLTREIKGIIKRRRNQTMNHNTRTRKFRKY